MKFVTYCTVDNIEGGFAWKKKQNGVLKRDFQKVILNYHDNDVDQNGYKVIRG